MNPTRYLFPLLLAAGLSWPVQAAQTPATPTKTTQAAPRTPAKVKATPDAPVALNTASLEDFQTLPGIGPVKAAAILAYRKEHGPFKAVEDLRNVKGIGPKTLDTLKPLLTLKEGK